MHNRGNYIISLGNLCRWLAAQAEELGVEIYPGFAAAEVLYDEDGRVRGVATGDMGIGKDGEPTARYTPGVELRRQRDAVRRGLPRLADQDVDRALPSARELRPADLCDRHQGIVGGRARAAISRVTSSTRSAGRSTSATYGGSFLYHLEDRQVAVGFVIGLDYQNPFFSPFEEFQRFKTHPAIRAPLRRRAAHLPTARGRSTRAGSSRSRVSIFPAER